MKIGVDELTNFLKAFEPTEFKYSCSAKLDCSLLAVKSELEKYEYSYQYGSLTKQQFSHIVDNLRIVYGDTKIIEKDINIYHLVEDKIIHRYLGIPMLDRLFDEDYFNFEWDMHVGHNFNEHRNDYYRDHFLHQVRNLYMIYVLLDHGNDGYGFFDAIKKIMPKTPTEAAGSGKISEYVYKKQLQFLNSASNDFGQYIKKLMSMNPSPHYKPNDVEEYLEDYYKKYVIYASSFLSSLFHDMGYPICHFLEIRQRTSEYNPYLYIFTNNATGSFDRMFSKLNDSLLFTIVSAHEIKQRMLSNNGKYDHGVYSAIAFLMPFYETGLIYSLSEEKQCAIELAALAIYNHTSKYNCIKFDAKNTYYQPVFRQNPVSFLLRVCDDLQEWDRRYFEFSDDSDLQICAKCGAPLVPNNSDSIKSLNDNRKTIREYSCLCTDVLDKSVIKYESFLPRRIYVVRVADIIDLRLDGEVLTAEIKYDLYRMLKMCRVNVTYATHRLKELNEIKRILDQNLSVQSDNSLGFKYIVPKYFMTSNPILIKVRILEEYLNKYVCNWHDLIATTSNLISIILNDLNGDGEHDPKWIKSDCESKVGSTIPNPLMNYLREIALPQYLRILNKIIQIRGELLLMSPDEGKTGFPSIKSDIRDFVNLCISNINNDDRVYNAILSDLIEDCLLQYSKMPNTEKFAAADVKNPFYFKQFTPENKERLNNHVKQYCDREQAFNKRQRSKLNYYTDLHFFYVLNALIQRNDNGSTC